MKNPFVPEYGHVRAMTQAGAEFVFSPALSSMAAIGSPAEIVQTYAELHAEEERFCVRAARAVLFACAVDCDDLSELVGWLDDDGHHSGLMPNDEQVALAKHLMKNGIIGKAKPGESSGTYSETFDAAEHIANAVVHLGLSRAEAAMAAMSRGVSSSAVMRSCASRKACGVMGNHASGSFCRKAHHMMSKLSANTSPVDKHNTGTVPLGDTANISTGLALRATSRCSYAMPLARKASRARMA